MKRLLLAASGAIADTASPRNNIAMKFRPIILASCLTLWSCGEEKSPTQVQWQRLAVEGEAGCLGGLTENLIHQGVGIARFPIWKDDRGVIEFGPMPSEKVGMALTTVRDSKCAIIKGTRPSCTSDNSDVRVC
jgi:hypothetical protein